jgi:hypothetical protein
MVYEPGVESSGFFMRMEKKGKEIFVAGIIWNGNAVFLASGTASLEYSPCWQLFMADASPERESVWFW